MKRFFDINRAKFESKNMNVLARTPLERAQLPLRAAGVPHHLLSLRFAYGHAGR